MKTWTFNFKTFILISQEILQLRSLSYYCGHHFMRSSFPVNVSCCYQKSQCQNWMLNIRHQMFLANYQIFILNYFLSEIFSDQNFSKVQFSIKYPVSFSFSYSMDEEKQQWVQWRHYGTCWIDMCSNDLLHKALSFQKMSIQNVSATNFLDD